MMSTKQIVMAVAVLVAAGVPLVMAVSPAATQNPADATVALTRAMDRADQAYRAVSAYTADVLAQERLGGKLKTEKIRSVVSKNPFRAYFQWVEGGLHVGMKASYVAERDGPRHLLARGSGAAGLAGVQKLAFDSVVIKKVYPHHFDINQYHLGFMLEEMRRIAQRAAAKQRLAVTDGGISTTAVPGKRLRLYRAELSADPADGFRYRLCLYGFDEATALPLLIENYGFQNEAYSIYRILGLQLNPPIDPSVFDLK
jgi:hypothetical protein